jgi:hypothetical protein
MKMTRPIRKSLTVPLRPADAFRLFTEGMGDWWPGHSHSVSAAKSKTPREIRVTPEQGGDITEITADGTAARWATITVFEPGRRFAFDWHVGPGTDEPSQVEVVFTPVDTGTRVDLTHDGLTMSAATRYAADWTLLMGQFDRVTVRRGVLITA